MALIHHAIGKNCALIIKNRRLKRNQDLKLEVKVNTRTNKIINALISATMLCCVANSSHANNAPKKFNADGDENIRGVHHEISHDHLPEEEAAYAIYKKQHLTSYYR